MHRMTPMAHRSANENTDRHSSSGHLGDLLSVGFEFGQFFLNLEVQQPTPLVAHRAVVLEGELSQRVDVLVAHLELQTVHATHAASRASRCGGQTWKVFRFVQAGPSVSVLATSMAASRAGRTARAGS